MEARSAQNHGKNFGPQVNFNPTAANIIIQTCCVFLSSPNNTFFSVLVIIFSNIILSFIPGIIFQWYFELFSNVYRELFFH